MAYIFTNVDVATIKFTRRNYELSLPGINGVTNDANVIVDGIQELLSIGGIEEKYDPEDAVRTVKQNVDSQD